LDSFANRISLTALNHEHERRRGVRSAVAVKPSPHIEMVVGSIVDEDHMLGFATPHLRFDRIEEADNRVTVLW
jgi:hypothetical protein